MFIKKVMLRAIARYLEGPNNLFNKGKTETKDSQIYPWNPNRDQDLGREQLGVLATRFQGIFASIIPMPQVSVTHANIKPHPTKVEIKPNLGST